jgi:predicted PurR-regulated permease PerM
VSFSQLLFFFISPSRFGSAMTDQQFPQAFGSAPSGPPQGNRASAREAVNIPSILLMAAAAISILYYLFTLVSSGGGSEAQIAKLMNDPNFPPALKTFAASSNASSKFISVIGLLVQGVVVFGALKMRNLQSYNLAMAATIISIIPCCGCCCIGIPVGIFSLVVLLKPEVKAAFE